MPPDICCLLRCNDPKMNVEAVLTGLAVLLEIILILGSLYNWEVGRDSVDGGDLLRSGRYGNEFQWGRNLPHRYRLALGPNIFLYSG
jgi:hypothetical protein